MEINEIQKPKAITLKLKRASFTDLDEFGDEDKLRDAMIGQGIAPDTHVMGWDSSSKRLVIFKNGNDRDFLAWYQDDDDDVVFSERRLKPNVKVVWK